MEIDLTPALLSFLDESSDLLQEMEEELMRFEETGEEDCIHSIFRVAHTIKGTGGLFNFEGLVAFTHVLETVLDNMRSGKQPVSEAAIKLLFASLDCLKEMFCCIDKDGEHFDADLIADNQLTKSALEALSATVVAGADQSALAQDTATINEIDSPEKVAAEKAVSDVQKVDDQYHISIRFTENLCREGMDPLGFINYLDQLGEITFIELLMDAIPDLDELDPEGCYFSCEIALVTKSGKADIEDVFEFVCDDITLKIMPPDAPILDFIKAIDELPESNDLLGDILVKAGAVTPREIEACLQSQRQGVQAHHEVGGEGEGKEGGVQEEGADDRDEAKPPPLLGQALINDNTVSPTIVDEALKTQKKLRNERSQKMQSLRIAPEKLDKLIDLIGELVINNANTQLLASQTQHQDLMESMAVMSHLIEEVRDGCLKLRMVAIGQTFNRYNRVVRDICEGLGKRIDLIIQGEETELDKGMVDKLSDPLTHLIRNALDHGIETEEERVAKGKTPIGTLSLNAYHESGSVVIEVKDDGKGIDPQVIGEKAIEKGVVASVEGMKDSEIMQLIFAPGFSTAHEVTDLSGRGVGMDVVKRNIENMRGMVEVDSTINVGSTIRITLPLTMAIIDGFLMSVSSNTYVIPLDSVIECVEVEALENKITQYINLRDEVLPVVYLKKLFELEGETNKRENIVVVSYGSRKAGLVIDKPLGEFQTVIKPLSQLFSQLNWMAGSTILGSGEVAIILDVAGLIDCTLSLLESSSSTPAPNNAYASQGGTTP